jgi:hypothetical protein
VPSTHFLFFFGDLDKSFSFTNVHASRGALTLNYAFSVHEALALGTSFMILV